MENKENNEQKPEEEILNFDKPDFTFIPKGSHDYRQRGYYLVCKGCDLEHAVYIGSSKIMVGVGEDGTPILKTRKQLGMA